MKSFLKYCFLDVSLHCQSVWGVVSLTALFIFSRAIRILGSILIVLSDCPGENSPSISLGSENVCNTTTVPFQGDINQTTQSPVSFFLESFFVLLFLHILADLCSINFIFLGGKLVYLYTKKPGKVPRCGGCPKKLQGVSRYLEGVTQKHEHGFYFQLTL